MKKSQNRLYSLLEFTLQPRKVITGLQKLKVHIKNTGDGVLRNLVLFMHSLNERSLSVSKCEKFIYAIMPGNEAVVDFQVFVADTAQIYVSLSGFKNGDVFFRTDSTLQQITVERDCLVIA